jgi:hypothetical protein
MVGAAKEARGKCVGPILVVSGGVGASGEQVARTALAQFPGEEREGFNQEAQVVNSGIWAAVKRRALQFATLVTVVLFALYLYHHRYQPQILFGHLFPESNIVREKQIVVVHGGVRGGDETAERQTPFKRGETAPDVLFRTNFIQQPELRLPVLTTADEVLFLQGGKLERTWEKPDVHISVSSLHSGEVVERLSPKTLLDEAGLKVLADRDHQKILVFYRTPEELDRGFAFLSYLHFRRLGEQLAFTYKPGPIREMFPSEVEQGARRLFGAAKSELYSYGGPAPTMDSALLGRFSSDEHLQFVEKTGVFESSTGAVIALETDGTLRLDLVAKQPQPSVYFTHYVFGNDLCLFLLGRRSSPAGEAVYVRLCDPAVEQAGTRKEES